MSDPSTDSKHYPAVFDSFGDKFTRLEKQALDDLTELAGQFPEHLKVTSLLREGVVVDKILEETKDAAISSMVVPFTAPSLSKIWMDGLSTPFSLMALSSVPLVMLRSDAPVFEATHGLRFLLADDLKDSSKLAIAQCVELSTINSDIEVHQLHVADVDEAQIKRAIHQAEIELHMPKGGAALCVWMTSCKVLVLD